MSAQEYFSKRTYYNNSSTFLAQKTNSSDFLQAQLLLLGMEIIKTTRFNKLTLQEIQQQLFNVKAPKFPSKIIIESNIMPK